LFRFDAVYDLSLFSLIGEPVVEQEIRVEDVIGWSYVKHNFDANGELFGREILLVCELGGGVRRHDVPGPVEGPPLSYFRGICDIASSESLVECGHARMEPSARIEGVVAGIERSKARSQIGVGEEFR
jgi:hypothetical protein